MAEAAVSFLLEKVNDVVTSHVNLISGAENEFRKLGDDLAFLRAFLRDTTMRKLKERHLFREIERQIREVIYEVEDTVDTCLTSEAAAKGKGAFLRRLRRHHNISLAKQIKSLREEKVGPVLEKAKEDFSAMNTADGPGTSEEGEWMNVKKDQLISQERVVGFEDEEETIIKYLMEQKEELDVISIIGMPGLGKTTLAWKIFQNKKVAYEFPTRIWIHVSQKFKSRDMFLNILRKFKSEDMSNLSDQELIERVHACLEDEKFLLVLDDIWSIDDWKTIQNVLPQSNGMGKILMTSRQRTTGMYANAARKPHMLRFLTPEESWKLLQLNVFGNLKDCPQEMKDIGERIANQCDGVPLAIVLIGGILLDQFTKMRALGVVIKEWEKVSANIGLFLQTSKENSTLDVVALSYNGLPHHLKECFLYMGVFPEDYEIPAWTLTRLWIAEGFIQAMEGKSLEETAIENLDDLISRNLLMVVQINPLGEVKMCRVHSMIQAFCKSKAREQNLFQEIKISKGVFEPPISEVHKFRRLSLHSAVNTFLSEDPNGPHVRSFISFCNEAVQLEPKYTSAIPDAFELLRVLESKSIKFKNFPARISKLIHLRYITLSIDSLDVLPEPISGLWNLQTLVVETNSRTITLEANIWRMIRLRHLKTKAAVHLANTEWEGEASGNLQTLSRLSPESCTTAISEKARYLKTLGIFGKLATFLKTKSLEKLSHLEKLKLVNDSPNESTSEVRLQDLPKNCFPQNLKRLTLSNTFLDWKHMSTLAKIDTLDVLKLKNYAFSGSLWNADGDGFKRLQLLLIVDADFVDWVASANYFPSLRFLVLKNCENLKEIPECLGLAKHFEKLEIDRLRKSAVDSARKIEAAKRQELEQQKNKWGVQFMLHVGPGCALAISN